MTLRAGAFATVSPHYMEPELYMQNVQASGFIETLPEKKLRARLANDDLFVYAKSVNLRTRLSAGAASFNELPGVDITFNIFNTQTYLFKVRSQFDHHDVAAGARWGASTVDLYRQGMRQANFQLCRDACLKGMNPQNGEGLINAPNVTAVNMPPDQDGNQTASSVDNGFMAFYLLQLYQQLKTRTLQMGRGVEFTILGPQRTLGLFEYNVVQLTQFQRDGAGTASTRGTLQDVLMQNGDKLNWAYDDSLIGAGAGGTDLIILIMPELKKPEAKDPNTNVFAGVAPNNSTNFTQYCSTPAPVEILSPMAGGKTDFVQEWRLSSGWNVRGQATTLLSIAFS